MAAPVIHFEIHAAQPERALAFYRDVFGWASNAPPGMGLQYWLLYPSGQVPSAPSGSGSAPAGPGIAGGMLMRRGAPPEDGAAVNAFVCIIEVNDLDACHERVLANGGAIALPPMDIQGVGRVFYAKDTEGNLIGVLEPLRA